MANVLRSNPINLQREYETALQNMDRYFERKVQNELGIGPDAQKRLMLGKMRISYAGQYWWPAKHDEFVAPTVVIVPTGFDGWIVRDLMATDGRRCWFRLGIDDLLGDPGEMPIYTSVGEYLRNGGKGCVLLRHRRMLAA